MTVATKLQTVEQVLDELDSSAEWLAKLRLPFPPNQVSKLPKETKRQAEERKAGNNIEWDCPVCGGMHHKKAIHLDYVGHAALTDRLLDTDPNWSWEPMGRTPEGLPAINGGLWIKLTVCGVSRYGFGAADGKTGGDAVKEMIGDALRNAAMRFGAALELWHKGQLHVDDLDDGDPTPKLNAITQAQQFDITALAKTARVSIQTICEAANVSAIDELTEEKAASIIKKLRLTIKKKNATQAPMPDDILDDEIPY